MNHRLVGFLLMNIDVFLFLYPCSRYIHFGQQYATHLRKYTTYYDPIKCIHFE